jgi:integrase
MSILTEAEVSRLLTAYGQLEADPPDGTTAPESAQVRRIVVVALGTGLRRGELLALRWRDAGMLEGTLSVREAFVRGAFQTPKSRKSARTFGLGPVVAAALSEQYEQTRYRADTDLVFCHLALGSHSAPQSCPAPSCGPPWSRPRSPSRSAPGTTYATPRSR